MHHQALVPAIRGSGFAASSGFSSEPPLKRVAGIRAFFVRAAGRPGDSAAPECRILTRRVPAPAWPAARGEVAQ